MGRWIQERRGLRVGQLQIALLIFGAVALGVILTYHFAALPPVNEAPSSAAAAFRAVDS